ncbi:unnamed protein product [Symbiodinium natans]|uniref:Uncharacterized protein n=1 Tax=Symbiodinium natans TaxID=878477 RepID=A0A812N802_9DINO|nr:unnamed protein product [Symbiodinium natans]
MLNRTGKVWHNLTEEDKVLMGPIFLEPHDQQPVFCKQKEMEGGDRIPQVSMRDALTYKHFLFVLLKRSSQVYSLRRKQLSQAAVRQRRQRRERRRRGVPSSVPDKLRQHRLREVRALLQAALWPRSPRGCKRAGESCKLSDSAWAWKKPREQVSYHYAQFQPVVDTVLNAHSTYELQSLAATYASEISTLSTALFHAQEAAAALYHSDDHNCDPAGSMSDHDWHVYLDTLGGTRLLSQQVTWHFMQVALRSNVHTSKVELTVLMAETGQMMRSLVEGKKVDGIPAPPNQKVVDLLEHAWERWDVLSHVLTEAVHMEVIPGVMVDRVAQLSQAVLADLDVVMHHTEQAAYAASHSSDSFLVEQTSQQETLLYKISVEAALVLSGIQVHENWLLLNESRGLFDETQTMLLQGAPATNHSPAMEKQTQVCMIARMREVGDLFSQLEHSALGVAWGNSTELTELGRLVPLALAAAQSQSEALVLKTATSCENATEQLPLDSWLALHQEAATLARWSQRATCDLILRQKGRLEAAQLQARMDLLLGSAHRLEFGAFSPRVPAPPSQEYLDHFSATVSPALDSFEAATAAEDVLAAVAAGEALRLAAEETQARYLKAALAARPTWPGDRVDAVTRELTQACVVFREALLYTYGQRSADSELQAAVANFEAMHQESKDGGDTLEPIVVARQDILEQWDRVGQAWATLKGQLTTAAAEDMWRSEQTLEVLLAELSAAIPLYSKEDDVPAEHFPYSALIYASVGGCLFCGCCAIICYNCRRKGGPKDAAKQMKMHQPDVQDTGLGP